MSTYQKDLMLTIAKRLFLFLLLFLLASFFFVTESRADNYDWFYLIKKSRNDSISQIESIAKEYRSTWDNEKRKQLFSDMNEAISICNQLTKSYNQKSKKIPREIFLDWGLPYRLEHYQCK